MLNFATLFDYNYLSRGLALIDSLTTQLKDEFKLYVLALDDLTLDYFTKNNYPQVEIIKLTDLEKQYPELLIAKSNRTKIEYYFTLSPILPLYILEVHNCPRITTLDADIYFYSDPSVLFRQYHDEDILITPHDFSSNISYLTKFGYYNVSFQSFPNTKSGLSVLKDWKKKCLTWCGDTFDETTQLFADQKYLDFWKEDFSHIRDIELKTCGRAPWNLRDTPLILKSGRVFVNNAPLIYYHFHHLRIYGSFVDVGLLVYGVNKTSRGAKKAYTIYIKNLNNHNKKLRELNDNQILRLNYASTEKTIFHRIWEKELGALLLFNQVFFFDIRLIKRAYNYFLRKINGLFN